MGRMWRYSCLFKTIGKYYERLSYHLDLPSLWQSSKEARLRFVEGASLRFDAFPDYLGYEVIPMVWDCWPRYVNNMARWFEKYHVRTAFSHLLRLRKR